MANFSLVIIITGASSGFGAETARRLARDGHCLVLAARRVERLDILAHEIESLGGQALVVAMDITRRQDIEAGVQAALARFGRIDVLVNNAGFGRMDWLEMLDPEEDIAALIQTNLVGLIQMSRAVLPGMIAQRSGHIINISSVAGLIATPTYSVYAASKFGVRGFSDALRREVGIYDVQVSTIYPAGARTEFFDKAGPDRRSGLTTPQALRLSADDVATTIVHLLKHPRRSVILPWYMQWVYWVTLLFPGVTDWVIEKVFVRRERGLSVD
jgi:uncharacterized protein